jgi:hypothetical protein
MDFLHTDFSGGPRDIALVTLDGQANVMLLDDANFSHYRQGQSFRYHGGWATKSPVRLVPPRLGHWHVVVDFRGQSGAIRAGVRVVRK